MPRISNEGDNPHAELLCLEYSAQVEQTPSDKVIGTGFSSADVEPRVKVVVHVGECRHWFFPEQVVFGKGYVKDKLKGLTQVLYRAVTGEPGLNGQGLARCTGHGRGEVLTSVRHYHSHHNPGDIITRGCWLKAPCV